MSFLQQPTVLHEHVSQCLGLDKNIVIDGGFYTKQQLENLFAKLPLGAGKNSKVNFGLQIDKSSYSPQRIIEIKVNVGKQNYIVDVKTGYQSIYMLKSLFKLHNIEYVYPMYSLF